MKPTLAAAQLRGSLTQYLTTTYALADEDTRLALERFLGDPETGIFRGPYLRIRTPFHPADDEWRSALEWQPSFTPWRHQAKAWERLSTYRGAAEPTLVTTGTGSGKTESFLIPVLDHCRRQKALGRRGVKAVLLYPMNALATDQAGRIGDYLAQPELAQVTAGLYIGDKPDTDFRRVMTRREEMRQSPPDVLITNYKMLDLLLQRAEDRPLWEDADPAYVVLDEFHTYDGAQGTDVAMLLRRLAAAVGASKPERPLGAICPVATSATLGEGGGDTGGILTVAEQVFGVPFGPDAVIGEERLSADDFVGDIDYELPEPPSPKEVIDVSGGPGVESDPDRLDLDGLAERLLGRRGLDPFQIGRLLKTHDFTHGVLALLNGEPLDEWGLRDRMARFGYAWARTARENPRLALEALSRFVALLSSARDPESDERRPRPLLHIEAHLWVRPVGRVLSGVGARPEFRWYEDERTVARRSALTSASASEDSSDGDEWPTADSRRPQALPGSDTVQRPAQAHLPAIYCRVCGRSGWAALSPEADPQKLETSPLKIWQASVGRDKRRLRYFVSATAAEARDALAALTGTAPKQAGGVDPQSVVVLDGAQSTYRLPVAEDGEGFRTHGSRGRSWTRRPPTRPPRTTPARRATPTTASGSSAPRSPRWPPPRSPSCSPAARRSRWRRRSARRCCSTTPRRTRRTAPDTSPTPRTSSRCARCWRTNWTTPVRRSRSTTSSATSWTPWTTRRRWPRSSRRTCTTNPAWTGSCRGVAPETRGPGSSSVNGSPSRPSWSSGCGRGSGAPWS